MSFYSKCKNCGRMKLQGHWCNICLYTDPDEKYPGRHDPDNPTCMCVECLPTPKEPEDAADSATTEADYNPDHDELGVSEAG